MIGTQLLHHVKSMSSPAIFGWPEGRFGGNNGESSSSSSSGGDQGDLFHGEVEVAVGGTVTFSHANRFVNRYPVELHRPDVVVGLAERTIAPPNTIAEQDDKAAKSCKEIELFSFSSSDEFQESHDSYEEGIDGGDALTERYPDLPLANRAALGKPTYSPWLDADQLALIWTMKQNNKENDISQLNYETDYNPSVVHHLPHQLCPEQHFINSWEENSIVPRNFKLQQPPAIFPRMHVFPLKPFNFANLYIQFVIQVFNIPRGLSLSALMFEAVAETPSGKILHCQVKTGDSFVESFHGSFRASEESGLYDLRVRMILPMNVWRHLDNIGSDGGVVTEVTKIIVSRNYLRECDKVYSVIQCDYQITEDSSSISCPTSSKVWGITCDKLTNHIFYADRASHKVACITPDGRMLYSVGQNSKNGRMSRPSGVAIDEVHRRLVVADKDNHRISFYTIDGQYISSFGTRGHLNGMFNYPWDVAVSPVGGEVVVADSRNKRIQLFDRFGNYIRKYSVYERNPFEYKTSFDYPRGICFDPEGKYIYVTDFNVQTLSRLPLDLSYCRKIVPDKRLRRPQGVVSDKTGGLLVADSRNHCIRHLTSDGILLSSIRNLASENVEYPVNVAVLSGGYVAVLDGNARIRIF